MVYNTTWALLAALDRHNNQEVSLAGNTNPRSPIHSLLMPGLGTGTGNIPYRRFALQFGLAVKYFDEAIRNPDEWSSLEWDRIGEINDELKRTCD